MNRKQRREAKKQMKKDGTAEAQEKMGQKFSLIGKMPNECQICGTEFDKNSREMAMSWRVIVREEKEQVDLYCPNCFHI
jgi:hypothetical protein